MLILVATIFFMSSASGQKSFQNQDDIKVPGSGDTDSDTLVQELEPWTDQEGRSVRRLRLTNTRGLTLTVISWGATITGLMLPDGEDIVLGYDTIEEYHVWLFKQPGHTRPLDQTKTLHSGVADPISKAT